MRVIGGDLRGRRLHAPVSPTVRPTSDRVREAIFDMLFSLGGVDGWRVADLFCGSGALGIEALSRGAGAVTFVDSDPAALQAVRANLDAVGLGQPRPERETGRSVGRATPVRADVLTWLPGRAGQLDLVLCDPPYRFDRWDELLPLLVGDLVVVESASGIDLPLPPGWSVLRSKRYGGTIVTVARPVHADKEGSP